MPADPFFLNMPIFTKDNQGKSRKKIPSVLPKYKTGYFPNTIKEVSSRVT
jgi:hypothetical protein